MQPSQRQTLSVYLLPKSCIPITAKMKMMIERTKVRFERDPNVFAMIVRISLSDFQDFANLKTLSNLKDLSIESPLTPSKRISTRDNATITKSKQFQPSWLEYKIVDFKASISVFYRKKITRTHCKEFYSWFNCKDNSKEVVSICQQRVHKRRPMKRSFVMGIVIVIVMGIHCFCLLTCHHIPQCNGPGTWKQHWQQYTAWWTARWMDQTQI